MYAHHPASSTYKHTHKHTSLLPPQKRVPTTTTMTEYRSLCGIDGLIPGRKFSLSSVCCFLILLAIFSSPYIRSNGYFVLLDGMTKNTRIEENNFPRLKATTYLCPIFGDHCKTGPSVRAIKLEPRFANLCRCTVLCAVSFPAYTPSPLYTNQQVHPGRRWPFPLN